MRTHKENCFCANLLRHSLYLLTSTPQHDPIRNSLSSALRFVIICKSASSKHWRKKWQLCCFYLSDTIENLRAAVITSRLITVDRGGTQKLILMSKNQEVQKINRISSLECSGCFYSFMSFCQYRIEGVQVSENLPFSV